MPQNGTVGASKQGCTAGWCFREVVGTAKQRRCCDDVTAGRCCRDGAVGTVPQECCGRDGAAGMAVCRSGGVRVIAQCQHAAFVFHHFRLVSAVDAQLGSSAPTQQRRPCSWASQRRPDSVIAEVPSRLAFRHTSPVCAVNRQNHCCATFTTLSMQHSCRSVVITAPFLGPVARVCAPVGLTLQLCSCSCSTNQI